MPRDSAVSRRKFMALIESFPLIALPFGDDSGSSPTELVGTVLDGLLRDHLEDEDQAEQVTRTIATEICEYAESLSALELDQYDEQNLPTAEDLRRVHEIAEILNAHLDAGIDTVPVEQVYDKARAVESYLPVLAAAERLIDESCKFTQEDQAGSYTRLYIAFGVFTAECALFFSSITYRTAFSGTRYLANNLLVHFRDRMTLTLYAILLREVHWAIRTSIASFPSYLWAKTEELADKYDDFASPKWRDALDIEILRLDEWVIAALKNQWGGNTPEQTVA